ncbi:unnamed protein product (macronuclear) [Paramecium tetraurelia]|uniref:Uncharacterized protein n=1 Tax=Paramecium tetraurelia TaxID=5888 RepID=A0BQY0_PARTE|nr:uncharacterized protein GSPATT00031176001 [Paramecium tetraurelia]CAK60947.1 unnamed protein product [Paramecium tetraurelia]|eukprot:XP_001428345.1 hypothetical protein (macronuclear) [Paramecium tetraurelia strain d4-2]
MLIIKQQRNLLRKTTLKQSFIPSSPYTQRRASCYCDQCGKLTRLQSLFLNTPLTVQQHLKSAQLTSQQLTQIKKQISTSFHLPNAYKMDTGKKIKRRKSCNCNLCGNQTNFQQTTNYKIPQRQALHQDSFRNFIVKKQLGRVFKEISDHNLIEQSAITSRSKRDTKLKCSCISPFLIKHEMSRKGRAIQKFYESKGLLQSIDLRRQKTEKSPPAGFLIKPYHKLSKYSKTSDKLMPSIRFKSTLN